MTSNDTSLDLAHPSPAPRPLARVYGVSVTEVPQDLYIPPEALEVFLETFEGPLDLLLYLIRRRTSTCSTSRWPSSRASIWATSR